jgi:outer membrane protein OmpA-like peptidoglycan-associated protein
MFGHALVGGAKVGGPNYPGKPACTTKPCEPGTDIYVNCCTWGPGLTAGGGLDYIFPWFNSRIALRVFQADYEYIHVDFGNPPFVSSNVAGGRANISAAQVSSGLVWRFGVIAPPPPVTYACSVTPAVVFPGDTITITGTASNLNPKRTAAYSWTATSGPVTGTTATVTINTAQLAPGNYTVTGHVTEGNKAGEMADCTASYTVRAYEPPTVTCSANPSTVSPGQDSAITAMGMSPQNRPLTYSYSASAGTIDASTTTSTTLHTTGAASGSITVTCNVQDDKGQSASANTMVTVEAPAPPPAPKAEKLCSITFDRDKKRPTRVDNEAKACLDEVALSAQQHADAKIVVVGESAPGKMSDKMAKERAVNTKAYLVTEKGVDASRIDVRTGPEGSNQVENYMVPAGANMDADFPGTMAFDADSVKAQSRMAPAKHHRRGAEHAAPQHSGSENGMHAAPQGTAPAQQ